MPETAEVLKKLGEIGDQIKHVQDTNDRLQKDYDGLDFENVKINAEKAATAMEEVQELKQKIIAEDWKSRFDEIELAIARGGGNEIQRKETEKQYKKAMTAYLRKGTRLDDDMLDIICKAQAEVEYLGIGEDEKVNMLKKDIVAGSGPDGGYYIMPDRAGSIVTRVFETSPVRPLCSVVTTTSDVWETVLDDEEFSAGWVGEVEARPTTDTAEVGLIRIPIHEVFAKPRATQKMLDDSGFDIEAWINGKVSRKFSRFENSAFVTGNGSKKPKGFLAYSAWASAGTYERNKVEQITATGTAGSLTQPNDLIKLQNSLLEDYQTGASWGMHRDTFASIMQLKDTAGQYLLDPRILKTGTDKILLGKNVTFMADIPKVAANALAVVYADWREFYTIVDRFGIRLIRDIYMQKPFTLFYTTKRVGGGVTNFEAGKILKINAS